MNVKTAQAIVGGPLGKPSKMPGPSYGLPASACNVGGRLQSVEGSPCSGCYALKNHYLYPSVQVAHGRRLTAVRADDLSDWVEAMTYLIARTGTDVFRWHDSGDLQSADHLVAIMNVAHALPGVRFWIPTQERAIVREVLAIRACPPNLAIRVSAPLVDRVPNPRDGGLASYVTTSHDVPAGVHLCPAPQQENECGSCRACWDVSTPITAYLKH